MQKKTTNNIVSGKKKKCQSFFKILLVFCIISLTFFTIFFTSPVVFSKTPMFIPSTPQGTTFGYVGIDYEYAIVTLNPDSFWMFDWGDGTNSSWLQLEQNQTSITETHHWDAVGTYQLHVKYKSDTAPYGIWSDAMIVEIATYSNDDYPYTPILYTGKIQGFNSTVYTYSALTTDPYNYQVCYRFDYGNGTFSDWTPYVPSGTSSYLSFAWKTPGVYVLRTQARNQYGLESDWSEPVQVIITDKKAANGASIDLLVLNNITYQLIYTSEYEGTFYNPSSGASNDIQWKGGGVFLIDDDSDGRWEYLYIPSIGQVQPYDEPIISENNIFFEIPWLIIFIILIIIFGAVGVVFVLLKTGYLYLYEEEVEVEK
jgi:hypothetical protein